MDAQKRKQLKNSYKSKVAEGAVYAILCSGNDRKLIKSTVDIEGIKNRFEFSQTMKGCPEPTLLNEWKKYGSESFSLVVLEELKMKEGQTAKEFSEDIKTLRELWLEKSEADEIGE